MISEAFKDKPAFIAYITGGDGGVDYSLDCALALVQGGADLIELGLPFSDPIADGPVIQKAMARALAGNVTPEHILDIAQRFKSRTATPLILFSYYNPLLRMGRRFLEEAAQIGVDGLLVIDLPFEERLDVPAEIERILIATPSSSEERLEKIGAVGQGFIYYAIQKGTTGIRARLPENFAAGIARVKKHTKLPVAAGFGIADRDSAEAVVQYADGFVVGSYFVDAMEHRIDPENLMALARSIDLFRHQTPGTGRGTGC